MVVVVVVMVACSSFSTVSSPPLSLRPAAAEAQGFSAVGEHEKSDYLRLTIAIPAPFSGQPQR